MRKYVEPVTGAEFFRLPRKWLHDGVITLGLDDDNCCEFGWRMISIPDPDDHARTHEDVRRERAMRYQEEVDPMTIEFTRKTITNGFLAGEKEELRTAISEKALMIQQSLPYPEEIDSL